MSTAWDVLSPSFSVSVYPYQKPRTITSEKRDLPDTCSQVSIIHQHQRQLPCSFQSFCLPTNLFHSPLFALLLLPLL